MTREEIIRNLKYTMEKHKNDTVSTFDTNILVMCKDILDYLEQGSKTEWIPVSERLPEDSQRVNITIQRNYTVYVTTATWDEMRGYFYNLGHAFDDVVAWRELPEPYKAEKPETCKGCLEPCIMYEPNMRACKKKVREVIE